MAYKDALSANYGNPNAGMVDTAPPNVNSLTRRIGHLLGVATENANRIQALADKVCGSVPQALSGPKNPEPARSHITNLQIIGDDLEAILSEQQSQICRLERAFDE